MTRVPVHVCEACGAVNGYMIDTLDMLAASREQVARLQEDVSNLETERRTQRALMQRLKGDQHRKLRAHKRYPDAMAVLEHWRDVCAPTARELDSETRLKVVIARLGAYGPDDLKRCADGYALKPFVVNGARNHEGPKDAWRADVELIFRDPKHVDEGLRIADRADELRKAFTDKRGGLVDDTSADMPVKAVEPPVRLAEHGLRVFPCLPGEKAPATTHGFENATTDVDTVRRFWATHPEHNVAVACGGISGVVVLDVDDDKGGLDSLADLRRKHGRLPDTLTVKTPRGGTHYWFRHPGREIRNTTDFPGPGLDIRGDGGYVLVPPSVVNDRAYEWDERVTPAPLPDWLTSVLLARQQKQAAELHGSRDWARFITQGADMGQRNVRMTQFVGLLIARGMTAREAYATARVLNGNVRPPLPATDLATIVKSIARRHQR